VSPLCRRALFGTQAGALEGARSRSCDNSQLAHSINPRIVILKFTAWQEARASASSTVVLPIGFLANAWAKAYPEARIPTSSGTVGSKLPLETACHSHVPSLPHRICQDPSFRETRVQVSATDLLVRASYVKATRLRLMQRPNPRQL
jgi:hypothetical protein